MDDVVLRIGQMRSATAQLLTDLAQSRWSDDDVRMPSLLPGWTRAHVLAHLAGNADSIARTLGAVVRGEILERYPGVGSRESAIDAASAHSAADLIAEVRDSGERLDRVVSAVGDADAWGRLSSEGRTADEWLARRWREVEIHRVDLAGDYRPELWPAEFVRYLLNAVGSTIADRASQPVHVQVSDSDLVFRAGGGEPRIVRAPGWAVAAWLIGRDQLAGPLAGGPALAPWI